MAMKNALKLRGTVCRDRRKNGGNVGTNGPKGKDGPRGETDGGKEKRIGRQEGKRERGEKNRKKSGGALVLDGGLSPSPPSLGLAAPN